MRLAMLVWLGWLVCGSCARYGHPTATGALRFEIVDKATRRPMPGRLTLVSVTGGRPKLTRGSSGEDIGGSVVIDNRILSRTGRGQIDVPVGQYDLHVSRGIEWTLVTRRIDVREGSVIEVREALEHVVSLPGWISADFHVHAERSWDSVVPMEHRIHEFLAEGVDVIVSTDHDVVADYGPVLLDLGDTAGLTSIVGDEITTEVLGHFGVFPLPASWNGRTFGNAWRYGHHASQFIPTIRAEAPDAVIQVNHPRAGGGMGYFVAERYDPSTDKAGSSGYSGDFDAIELLNGYKDADRAQFEQLVHDWFELLDHGHMVTATGNSDTHTLEPRAGYPRNYVQSGRGAEEVATALRAHRAFFTTGPLVTMSIGTAGIGEIVRARGKTRVDIRVLAAPWIATSLVRVYVGGRVVETIALDSKATGVVRLERSIELDVASDSYVVLRVDGDRPLRPIVNGLILPHAMTNPIYLDADGDGKITRRH